MIIAGIILHASTTSQVETFSFMNRRLLPFSAKTTAGASVTPATLSGHSSVMFVFCSCIECRRLAEKWSALQKKRTLVKKEYLVNGKSASTYVVYLEDADRANEFQRSVGLQDAQIIPDPNAKIAALFRALPCPTVFVVDSKGIIRYASKEVAGDLVSDPSMLVSQALSTLANVSSGRTTKVSSKPEISEPGQQLSPRLTGKLELEGQSGVKLVKVIAADDLEVEQEFEFENRSSKTITLSQVVASCGCERVEALYLGKVVRFAKIPAGQRVTIRARVAVLPEIQQKSVSVWLYGPSTSPIGMIRIQIYRNGQ